MKLRVLSRRAKMIGVVSKSIKRFVNHNFVIRECFLKSTKRFLKVYEKVSQVFVNDCSDRKLRFDEESKG